MSIPEKMPRMPTHDRLMDATWSACHTLLSAARRGDGAEAAERIVRRNGRNRGSRSPDASPAPPLRDQRPRRVMPEECRALKQQP